MEKIENRRNLKYVYILLSVALILPSIAYFLTGRKISDLVSSFTFFYTEITGVFTPEKIIGTIFFIGIFMALAFVYYKIAKHHKEIFQNNKEVVKFVVIIASIFFLMLPLTSTDVFYYIGTGWSEAHYGVNPYYVTVDEVMEENEEAKTDEILLKMKGVWSNQTIVYGPIWPFICKILSGMSMGNLTLALFVYKLFNLILHLANAYLVYLITKRKRVFALWYALNPLALFDGIANVHNEILVIFFILLGLYFFIRKKNLFFTILFLAMGVAVKYFAILLVPFLVLYYYRKEKPQKKILYSSLWAILFIGIVVLFYLLYMRDLEVLKGVFTQQNKFANSIFIFLALIHIQVASNVSKGFMLAYIIIYLTVIIKLIFTKKEYRFSQMLRIYSDLLLCFLFGTITQFQTWYLLWLLPTVMWQKSENAKWLLSITIIGEISNIVYFTLYEYYKFGIYYCILMFMLIIMSKRIWRELKERELYEKNLIN